MLVWAVVGWCCAATAEPATAQRVQFPSPTPYAAPPTTGVFPPTATGVYPPSPSGVYPPASSGVFPPASSGVFPPTPQPSLAAPPAFDPYANSALGAPPIDVPYTAAPQSQFITPGLSPATTAPPGFGVPYATPPTTPTGVVPNRTPNLWTAPGTYNYQNSDGSVAKLQRFMQQISAEHTYLYGDGSAGDLAINRTELAVTFGVPAFYNPDTPILITPGFAFNWLDGPIGGVADLPPRVYDAYLDTAWHPQFTPILGADLGLRTGVWTDFEAVNSDSIRILGRGLGVISLSPRMDVHVGVWYLDRNRVKLLPAGGIHWRPGPEWDAYLIFPNPKLRKRFVNIGASQWWWYVAGEYGGGRWTIERDPAGPGLGADDDIDINDIRAIFGFEWETQTQARGHAEIGYVFDREILYDSGAPAKFDLDDTIMFRLGVDF